MARPKTTGVIRRVQLRIREDVLGVFDGYNNSQLSALVNRALVELDVDTPLEQKQVSIIRPESPISDCIARLFIDGESINILFPEKSEDFRDVVKKKHRYVWDKPFWSKDFDENQLCDRAAEIAHALLKAGFIVQSEYSGVTRLALEGGYQPEGLRTILCRQSGVYEGWLVFGWPRAEDYYDEAMAITGAKYESGSVIAPPEIYEEIEDFAETYDFSFSEAARLSIQGMKDSAVLGFVPSRAKPRKQRASTPQASNKIPASLIDD